MPMTLKRPRTPHYDDPVEVGKRLHASRAAAQLSQRELAFPGCSAAYISRIEHGERIPSLQVLRELSRRTGVGEDELAYGRERLDTAVAQRIRDAHAAVTSCEQDAIARAYQALSLAAASAAKTPSA